MRSAFANSEQNGAYSGMISNGAIEPIRLEIPSLNGRRREIFGALRLFRDQSLVITTTESISLSAIVTVQCDDVLLIGEVVACSREAERCWAIRIKVVHTLKHLEILTRLRSEL